MAIKTEKLLSRLNDIEEVIRPAGSIKARIAALSEDDYKTYLEWKQSREAYNKNYKGNIYEALLKTMSGIESDYSPPVLSSYISSKIYPELSYTENAQDDYLQLMESIR